MLNNEPTPSPEPGQDGQVLDAAGPLERIKLLKDLGGATAALKGADTPIARIKAGKAVADALLALGVATQAAEDAPGAPEGDDGLSDDPASPNYRYKDTGYIADSRKEKAADVIRQARVAGKSVRTTDIDWSAIEQNPRQAAELIVKSNLFGSTDWDALRATGMDPAAGFLIDKVYSSIATTPSAPSVKGERVTEATLAKAQAFGSDEELRKSYALGLETIRARLEPCLTVDAVMQVLTDIRGELSGSTLTAEESEKYAGLRALMLEANAKMKALREAQDVLYSKALRLRAEAGTLTFDIEKRKKRGWAVDEKKQAEAAEATGIADVAWREWGSLIQSQRDQITDLEQQQRGFSEAANDIVTQARRNNYADSPATRAWLTFGERFFKLVNYRTYSGSDAFAGHVTSAKNDRIKDWSWADKERPQTATKKPTKEEIGFQLKVADTFERVGGRDVSAPSTQSLKEMLGLREVQSGNWVLRDQVSARFHVEQTAAAMSDMADVLGIDMKHLGLGGRLSMAFGARGSGGKNAARAHYEPVHRVVNLTKMGGGGALGHELFHAIDNILPAIMNGNPGSVGEFATAMPGTVPDGKVRQAFEAVKAAITTGGRRLNEQIKVTPRDRATAKLNLDKPQVTGLPATIKRAGSLDAAVMAVDSYFGMRSDKRSLKNKKQWRTIAAAYYAPEDADMVMVATGMEVSDYMAESQHMDAGQFGKYWSQVEELSARAFQAYLEDKLAADGRRNDYLSSGASNSGYLGFKPFPEGEERTRINAAFDTLFSALKEEGVFERASANAALLDSIFGPLED